MACRNLDQNFKNINVYANTVLHINQGHILTNLVLWLYEMVDQSRTNEKMEPKLTH